MKQRKRSEIIGDAISAMKKIRMEYDADLEQIGQMDYKQQELLHDIEDAAKCDDYYKISTKLHALRKDRRKLKRFIHDYKPVYDFMEKNPRLITQMETLLGLLRHAENMPEPPKYIPKIERSAETA